MVKDGDEGKSKNALNGITRGRCWTRTQPSSARGAAVKQAERANAADSR